MHLVYTYVLAGTFKYLIVKLSLRHHSSSAAKCLGARRVCQQAYQWLSKHKILSCVVEDQQAASACLQFAGEWTTNNLLMCKLLILLLSHYVNDRA